MLKSFAVALIWTLFGSLIASSYCAYSKRQTEVVFPNGVFECLTGKTLTIDNGKVEIK